MHVNSSVGMTSETAADAADVANTEPGPACGPAVRGLARFGYAAMGTLYVVIGMAAGLGAFDRVLRPADFTGAFALLGRGWVGVAVGVVVVGGLGGQAAWLMTRALLDPERESRGWLGKLSRAGSFLAALTYLGMGWVAVRVLWAGPGHPTDPGGDRVARDWSAAVMNHPAGRWAVAAAGVGFVAYACYEAYRAWHGTFDGRLDLGRLSGPARWWPVHVSRFGMAARAVLLGLVGAFLVVAAVRHDPAAARGLGGTLAAVRASPSAAWAYPVLAVGMAAYGLHNFVLAGFRRFPPPAPAC
jgi:hypothetical protein